MIGTIVNTGTILAGSLLGSALKKGINEKYQEALYTAMGLAATGLGINAVGVEYVRQPVSCSVYRQSGAGQLLGTILNIDGKFQGLMGRLGKSELGKGLSTGILLYCIGSLSILGPMQSALYGDHTYLFTMQLWILSHPPCSPPLTGSAWRWRRRCFFAGRGRSIWELLTCRVFSQIP